MPNGFHGRSIEWTRLEAPLLPLDPTLESFASAHQMDLSRNYHDWPERSLAWGVEPQRLIQIFLADETLLTWTLWVCVFRDHGGSRYRKQADLLKAVTIGVIANALSDLLLRAEDLANSWTIDDLELATKLG